jgi:hypothetical protein
VSVVRVVVRQLPAPGWVAVEVDDPECCDRCDKFAYVIWRRAKKRLCPYCITAGDFDKGDEVLGSGK